MMPPEKDDLQTQERMKRGSRSENEKPWLRVVVAQRGVNKTGDTQLASSIQFHLEDK